MILPLNHNVPAKPVQYNSDQTVMRFQTYGFLFSAKHPEGSGCQLSRIIILKKFPAAAGRLFKPDPEQGSGFLFVRGLACSLPSCGWLSAAEPAKEGYAGLEVDILCLEVGVGIRFTARIRSGGRFINAAKSRE